MNEDVHYLQSYAEDYAQSIGLPSGAAYALIDSESAFMNIPSEDGLGFGPAQISWDLAQARGIDIYDPRQNIKLGLDYLKEQYDAAGGDLETAYAYYKHGPYAGVTRSQYSALAMERYNNYNGSSGTDTSYSYPSDEQELDLSHILPVQDGLYDSGLSHTNKRLLQQVTSLNSWAYNKFGKDMVVSGGWRDEAYNAQVNGSPTSLHLQGQALDIDVSSFSPEERDEIVNKAQSMGITEVLYHDAGTGLHLHLGVFDPNTLQALPTAGDFLPDRDDNTDWFGDGAVSNPWEFNKEQLLGSYNMDTSGFWKSVEEPTVLQALAHGWERGNNFFTNFMYQLGADLFHSDNNINTWQASKEEMDYATKLLYGNRQEAERIAEMARDKAQFDYFLQDRKEFLDEEVKYRDYYSGIGIHWLGTMAAGVLDPTMALPMGQLAKAANIAKTAAAIKISRNIGDTVKNVEAIERISKISAKLAAKNGYETAVRQAERIVNVGSHAGAQGIIKTTVKAGFSGAVTNIAQDYLVSKATYNDTHMEQAALMGALGGGVLHVIGRTAKYARRGVNRDYVNKTQKMRSAAERVEEGTLREAAGLQNQYKVSVAHIIDRMAHSVDEGFFNKFGDDITAITDKNRVFAIARADAKKIAGDAGVQLDPKARAFYDPSTKSTFIIKEAVKDKNSLYRLLRHEIGVHQNLKATMGDENYQRLMNQIEQGRQNPESVWARASAAVDSFDPEEILGYAIEHDMLNAHEARHLLKGIKQGLNKMGIGKREKLSDKEILDFVSESLANARADKHGLSMHTNPDGSVVLNGLKFSKENMGNPNSLMDTLNMSIAGIKNKPKGAKNAILDAMDGKGVFNRFTATQFGDVYHSPIPALSKFAAELWTDEQGRGTMRMGVIKGMPTVEEMADWIQGQLISHVYRIGEHRNKWLKETQGRFAVQNPLHADSRRLLFNKAAEMRFNQDYARIIPRNLPKDIRDMLDDPNVIAAAKEMKAYREHMLEMAKTSGEKFGLTLDEEDNLMEKAWEPIDEEWFRVADDDAYMNMITHFGAVGDKGMSSFLKEYAMKAANREKCLAVMKRNQHLRNLREVPKAEKEVAKARQKLLDNKERYSRYLEGDNKEIDAMLSEIRGYYDEVAEMRKAYYNLGEGSEANRIAREQMKDRIHELEILRRRAERKLDTRIGRAEKHVAKGAERQNDLLNEYRAKLKQVEELKEEPEFTAQDVEKWIEELADGFAKRIVGDRGDEVFDSVSSTNIGHLNFFKQRLPMDTSLEMEMPDGHIFSFDKDLRNYDIDYVMQKTTRRLAGEAAMKNFLTNQGLTLEGWRSQVFKQIDALKGQKISVGQVPYYKNKFDDMIKDLRGMASRQDNYGTIGAIAKVFKNLAYIKNGGMMGFNQLQDLASGVATMNKYLTAKLGKENLDELNNLSMMLEGEQIYGQLFKTGFRDYSTRQAIATASSRPRRFLADAADFTRNLANVVSHYNGLGRLTDNQHKMATIQAIVDAAQWAYGRKFSKWRNPFSEAKLKELGISKQEIEPMRQDIRTYLGWKGTKDSDFTVSRWRDWMKESPTTFWHFRQLIHNQATRSVISDSRGNANMLTKNSMLASALLMFKGFTFRANNARFARALRAGDRDDALAFGLDMLFGGMLFAARQGIKVGALLALGQTEQAKQIQEKYLNEATLARAALFRSAYTSPASLGNDVIEAVTGAPTIRTTVSNARRTRDPQSIGEGIGNFVGQTPVLSTMDSMLYQPYQAIKAFLDGRGSQNDVKKIMNVLPVPNIVGMSQAVDTLVRTQLASGLPERRPTRRRTNAVESQQSVTEQITNLFN